MIMEITRLGVLMTHVALSDAELAQVICRARTAKYETVPYGGANFPGMAVVPIAPLDEVMKRCFGIDAQPGISYFRKGNQDDAHESFIHYDHGLGNWSLILYLSDSVMDGTAFWKHRATGVFDATQADQAAITQMHADQMDETKWEMIDLIPMRSNRAILFSTTLLHSRYPYHPIIPDRLVQVGFFT
jgi:hypothetical protein